MSLARIAADYFRELWTATIDGWNRFWFTPADPATLGLIRLLAGSMMFYTHLVWTFDFDGFLGPHARIAPAFAQAFHGSDWGSSWAWSHLFWIQSPALLWTMHIASLVILAMFAVGLFTRITSILAFLIVVTYAHRAAGALFGLDQINGLLALYLMIGPSGAAYSLDNLLRAWRRSPDLREPKSSFGRSGDLPHSTSANIAIRLIQVHMCIVYLFAGFGKLLGDSWWSGTAMWGAFGNYEYQSLDMTWLAAWPLVINFLSHLTIVWECSYCVFVWPRLTRPIVIALAVPLHLGIAFCMGMITFGLIMLVGNLAFVSPQLVRLVVNSCFVRSGRETSQFATS